MLVIRLCLLWFVVLYFLVFGIGDFIRFSFRKGGLEMCVSNCFWRFDELWVGGV